MGAPSSVSLVIEWENADRVGILRAERALSEVRRQLQNDLPPAVVARELIVVVSSPASRTDIEQAISNSGVAAVADVAVAVSSSRAYYEQKNFGASRAKGELIVFLDSDVTPEPGWLAALIAPFEDPDAEVVGGESYIEVLDTYSAAMALGWFFPLRSAEDRVKPATTFWANNVAFRRHVFSQAKFPRTGQYRGQCLALAQELGRRGRKMLVTSAARVSHPPPERGLQFVLRALRRGHDEAIAQRLKGRSPFLAGTVSTGKALLRALVRVARGYREVGLRLPGAGRASLIVLSNYLLQYLGLVAACIAPTTMRNRLLRNDG